MNWKMKSADTTDKHVPPTNEAKTEIIRPPEFKCEKKRTQLCKRNEILTWVQKANNY